MTRRTLFKILGLFPLVGPAIAMALVKSDIQPACPSGPYLPKYFPKWDRVVDGLESAGSWAIGIERSRLPSAMVVPRVGEIWETIRDCEVDFRPFVSGPLRMDAKAFFSLSGGKAHLRHGEKIRILSVDHPDKPLQVCFQPVRYDELHALIVPNEIRLRPGYSGYQMSVKTARTIADFGKDAPRTFFSDGFRPLTLQPAAGQ
jgi:hypothetical protein